MTDFFSTAVAMQKEILRAQQAQIDAAQAMLNAGTQMVGTQEAARKATEANVRAWKSWASLWGWK
jgi:hypothetical protein